MYSISPESDSRVGSETGIHVPHYIWLVIIATSTVRSPHVLLLDTITRGRY